MLLTLTTTHRPATDLGYLLHKNPARCQSFPLSFGQAHVFYPETDDDRCTAALLLDVDPVAMVRGRGGISQTVLAQYVNREYNVMWPNLPAGAFRHDDHRFEWSRDEFQTWAEGMANRFDIPSSSKR